MRQVKSLISFETSPGFQNHIENLPVLDGTGLPNASQMKPHSQKLPVRALHTSQAQDKPPSALRRVLCALQARFILQSENLKPGENQKQK